jgi:hypothetical protein
MPEENDRAASEINSRLPRSFKILAEWARKRGLIAKPKRGDEEAA